MKALEKELKKQTKERELCESILNSNSKFHDAALSRKVYSMNKIGEINRLLYGHKKRLAPDQGANHP